VFRTPDITLRQLCISTVYVPRSPRNALRLDNFSLGQFRHLSCRRPGPRRCGSSSYIGSGHPPSLDRRPSRSPPISPWGSTPEPPPLLPLLSLPKLTTQRPPTATAHKQPIAIRYSEYIADMALIMLPMFPCMFNAQRRWGCTPSYRAPKGIISAPAP